MISLIGYTGFAGSGKDTACQFAQEWLKDRAIVSRRRALADPLKECVNRMFEWDERHAFGELKEKEVEVSFLMEDLLTAVANLLNQHPYGDEVCPVSTAIRWRNILDASGYVTDVTFGIYHTIHTCKISPRRAYQLFGTELVREYLGEDFWCEIAEAGQKSLGGVMHIPDIRFKNEVDWMKQREGALLIGIHNPNRESNIGTEHPSEQYIEEAIDRAHIIIHNTGTLEDLRASIHYSLERMFH